MDEKTPVLLEEAVEVDSSVGEMRHSKQEKTEAWLSVLTSFLITAGIIILTIVIVIKITVPDPPLIMASAGSPSEDSSKKKEQKKRSKPAVAAAPMRTPVTNAISDFSLVPIDTPSLTMDFSTGVDLSDVDMSIGGGGFGAGELTPFGIRGTGPVMGYMYDLKQDRRGKNIPYNKDAYGGIIRDLHKSRYSDSKLGKYYKVPKPLGFTWLLIPEMRAEEGPKAFKTKIKPMGWFVHYKGRARPPSSGRYRFVGLFDDLLLVYVNGKLVFDGSWPDIRAQMLKMENMKQDTTDSGATMKKQKTMAVGKYVNFSGSFDLQILIGERPGGEVGGGLFVQKQGDKQLYLFALMPVPSKTWQEYENRMKGRKIVGMLKRKALIFPGAR